MSRCVCYIIPYFFGGRADSQDRMDQETLCQGKVREGLKACVQALENAADWSSKNGLEQAA